MTGHARKRVFDAAVVIVVSLVYLFLANHFRTSVLRQDWWWSLRRSDFASYAIDAVSGWSRAGLGAPQAYPTGYVTTLAIALAAYVLSPAVAQNVYLFAIGAACCVGSRRFAGRDAGSLTQVAVVLFATFNPWVYTETVAGHFYMILAYAGTMLLFGEAAARDERPRRLACAFLAVVQQLQFVFVPLAIFAFRAARRRSALPLAFASLLLVPSAIGIALNYRGLIGVPYLLAWEDGASVAPLAAIRLLGYFARYGAPIEGAMGWAMDVVLVVAAYGVYAARSLPRRAELISLGSFAAACTIYAMGTRGFGAPVFAWIVLTFPQSGILRELYDLLAYTAMGLTAFAAIAAERAVAARGAFLCAAIALAATWFFDPPSAYTVAAARIPQVRVDALPGSRFALFPAFQPFSFDGAGSGLDPDAFALPGDRTPLDEFVPSYPADTALARFAQTCDSTPLARLGVSAIVVRPWLRQVAVDDAERDGTQCASGVIAGRAVTPQVGVADAPHVGSLVSDPGAGNVFFADTERSDATIPLLAERASADATHGWVDARLGFVAHPEIGQAFGGVMTSSAAATFAIRSGLPVLAFVRGRLADQRGRTIAIGYGGYAWRPVPTGSVALRCYGFCVLALQGRPPAVALDPPAHPVTPVRAAFVAPFLTRAIVPDRAGAFLRYDVAYSPYWIALDADGTLLRHVRVDAATNGWYLTRRRGPVAVLILDVAAALEAVTIAIAIVASLVLVGVEARAFLGDRNDRSPLRGELDQRVQHGRAESR